MSDMIASVADSIMEIRFNRPEKKNAITGAMYDTITAALSDASNNDDISVVMFSGAGETFTAGNDLKDFLTMPPLLEASPPGKFIAAISRFGKPIVAAVNGLAVGIGTTMLLHCDLVYAAPEARFSVPFIDLGLVAEGGSSLLFPLLMGHRHAAAMLMLGDPLDAHAAQSAGLVNAVVPAGTVREHARAQALRLAAKPQTALRTIRALMLAGREGLHAQMRREETAFSEALASPEAKEAFAAFLERRKPDFAAARRAV